MSFGSGQQNIQSTNESNYHSHKEPYKRKKAGIHETGVTQRNLLEIEKWNWYSLKPVSNNEKMMAVQIKSHHNNNSMNPTCNVPST